jgi:ABC-type multidrug transport system permease subunit
MTMLRALLTKDLRRAWRNPLPWLLNLALPLCLTAIIGLVFGGSSDTSLGRIRFAVVDEDNSPLTRMLHGAMNQQEAAKHLEPVFLDRGEAVRQISEKGLSGAVIIPTNFTRDYLEGRAGVKLELIKNPSQAINPTVLEELLNVVTTALNALARNFQSEFPAWREALEGDFDYQKAAGALEKTGRRVESAARYLRPPLVVYETVNEEGDKESQTESGSQESNRSAGLHPAVSQASNLPTARTAEGAIQEGRSADSKSAIQQIANLRYGGSNLPAASQPVVPAAPAKAKPVEKNTSKVFAYLLPGISAMFLLFLAGTAVSDLLRELRIRTFERYQTMRCRLLPFVLSKVIFALVVLIIASAVLLGGGALIFDIHWHRPGPLSAVVFGYACFASALMALFVALMPDERRAGTLSNVVGMILAMAGGCMFPRHQLPKLLSEHVAPWLPSTWFVEAARGLQFSDPVEVGWVLARFGLVTALLLGAAVLLFRRRFRHGVRV